MAQTTRFAMFIALFSGLFFTNVEKSSAQLINPFYQQRLITLEQIEEELEEKYNFPEDHPFLSKSKEFRALIESLPYHHNQEQNLEISTMGKELGDLAKKLLEEPVKIKFPLSQKIKDISYWY